MRTRSTMSLPHRIIKAFGIFTLLIGFISGCREPALETNTPTISPRISITEVPIIDLKITIRSSETIAESKPAAVPTMAAKLTPTPGYLSYIIVSGDTLMDIAARFGTTLAGIEAINPGIDAKLLSIGQELNLPATNISNPAALLDGDSGKPHNLEVIGPASYDALVDNLWVIGAVMNNTSQPVGNVRVDITISAQNGQVVRTRETFTQPDIIFPGEMSPFAAQFENQESEDVIVGAAVIGQRLDADPIYLSRDLILEDISINSKGRQISYDGVVRNVGSEEVDDIIVSAIFFDEMGQVIGYRTLEIEKMLTPGASTAFSNYGIGFNDHLFRTEWAVHGNIVGE